MRYKQITVDDPEYQGEKELRNQVLREPLGLVLSAEDVKTTPIGSISLLWMAQGTCMGVF